MKIAISNRQNLKRPNRKHLASLARLLALPLEKATADDSRWHEISLVLGDDALMRELNAAWFERDGTTDVFSFRYPALPGEEPGVSGEVVVNVEEACRQGARRSRSSPQRELALYIAHGFHHLAGADDNTPARRRAMIRTEWRRVAAAARSVPLEELLT